MTRRSWAVLLVSATLLAACTTDEPGGGTGGAGANASAGNTAGGGGAAAGQAGGTGGSLRDQADITLGGFNQDLPAPAVDCTGDDVRGVACLSVRGEVDDEVVDDMGACVRVDSFGTNSEYNVSCGFSTADAPGIVGVWVPSMAIEAVPGTFEWVQTAPTAVDTSFGRRLPYDAVHLSWGDKNLNSGSPNLMEARVFGYIVATQDMWKPDTTIHEVRGAFAATWSDPQAGCEDPVISRGACAAGRIRGTFFIALPQR